MRRCEAIAAQAKDLWAGGLREEALEKLREARAAARSLWTGAPPKTEQEKLALWNREYEIASIIQIEAEMGLIEEALKDLSEVAGLDNRHNALMGLVGPLVKHGQTTEAEVLVRQIKRPHDRVALLSTMAAVYEMPPKPNGGGLQ